MAGRVSGELSTQYLEARTHSLAEEGRAYRESGNDYLRQGQYSQAIEQYERALAIAKEIGDRAGEGMVCGNLGITYRSLGQHQKAIEYHEQDLAIAREVGDRAGEGMSYGSLGNFYFSLGQHQKAIEQYEQCLAIAKELGDRAIEGKANGNLGIVYRNLGQYQKAIEYYEQDLAIARELSDRDGEGKIYCNLGIVYKDLGQYQKAIEYFKQNLTVAQELGDSIGKGRVYGNLGNVYQSLEQHQKAIEQYEQCLAIAKELGDRAIEGKANGNLGNAYNFLGQPQKAIEYHEQDLVIARELSDRAGEGAAYGNLGNAYESLGQYPKAIEYYEQDLVIARKLGDRAGEGTTHNNLGVAYKGLKNNLEAEGHFRSSIEVKASLQKALGNHAEWKITIFERQAKTYVRLETLFLEHARTNEALEVTEARRARALESCIARRCLVSTTLSSIPLKVADIQRLASQLNTTFVVYSLSILEEEKKGSVWVVSSTKIEYSCFPISDDVREKLQNPEELFNQFPFNVKPRSDSNPPLRASSKLTPVEEKALSRFKDRLSIWYKTFIQPIEDFLPEDEEQTVTIIPDGPLSQLPFALFQSCGEYLIEQRPICFAPSIHSLQLLLQRATTMPKATQDLIIGNPDTGNPKESLPFAEIEAETVSAFLEVAPGQTLLREKATVQNVEEQLQSSIRFAHLACHGQYGKKPFDHPHSVFEGCFKLAQGARPEFYAHDIAALSLNIDQLFLSACFSGAGKRQQEGSIGPIWSFLAAGAQTIAASYWRLPDTEMTVNIVREFYRRVLTRENRAKALRKAMLMAIQQERERPDLWGALFLTGLT